MAGFGVLALALTACSTFSGATRADSGLTAAPPRAEAGPPRAVEAALPADTGIAAAPMGVASASDTVVVAAAPATDRPATDAAPQTPPAAETSPIDEGMAQAREGDVDAEEYDPWERWNERMFEVNRRLDQYVLKPVARGYNFITPDEIQIMISNGFDNISFVPRLVNSLLQGKVMGAGRELSRFLINSTAGVGGLFDPAKDVFGILKSREDFGQTLCVWGSGAGPYVIMPLLEPLTVRDGVGKAVDSALDPLSYFLPFFWDRLGMKIGDIVNERSLNLDLFQGFEESVIDMYSAVRHAYLQRRSRLCRE
ncbi:MAG TPA: MlaA family lipoprotein [Methylomirabilota bacterium]|nr:MlaA family lipoprotein [Methylomirabilota bacterium]